jgi:hypothetical protein
MKPTLSRSYLFPGSTLIRRMIRPLAFFAALAGALLAPLGFAAETGSITGAVSNTATKISSKVHESRCLGSA